MESTHQLPEGGDGIVSTNQAWHHLRSQDSAHVLQFIVSNPGLGRVVAHHINGGFMVCFDWSLHAIHYFTKIVLRQKQFCSILKYFSVGAEENHIGPQPGWLVLGIS
jgi:hypothetical protein